MRLPKHCLQLAELFDCVEDVVAWVKGRDGRYVWVNRAFLIDYSLTRGGSRPDVSEVLGRTDYDLSPPFLADQFRADDEYVLTGRRIVNRIEMVQRTDGLTVWNVTNKIPLSDRGAVVGTAGITRRLDTVEKTLAHGAEFGPVLAHLRDHYQTTVTNRQLARIAHMSVRCFERNFRHTFHLTPQAYLRKLRLRVASRAVVYGDRPLADVALACGFSDQSHFTRVFRRHFGVTPRAYRDRYALGGHDAAPVPKAAAGGQAASRPAAV